MISDPFFYAMAVPAVILVGLSKGGFRGLGLLSLPMMALAISPIQAAAIMLPILIVQDTVAVWAYRRDWDRRNLLILLPSATVGVGLGYVLAEYVSDAGIALAVGLLSVAFAARQLLLERRGAGARLPEKPAGVAAGWFWGLLTGFTSMIGNAGGPTFQVYIMPQRLPRDIFVGTGSVFFAILNWIKVPPFMALGQFTAAEPFHGRRTLSAGDRLDVGGRLARASRLRPTLLYAELCPARSGRPEAHLGRRQRTSLARPLGRSRRSCAETAASWVVCPGWLVHHARVGGVSQLRNLVLQLQFPALEFRDLQAVRGWMGHGVLNLAFKRLVFTLKLRHISLQRHVGLSYGCSDSMILPQTPLRVEVCLPPTRRILRILKLARHDSIPHTAGARRQRLSGGARRIGYGFGFVAGGNGRA